MAWTPSSRPTSASDRPAPWAMDPEDPEMTFNEPIWARSAMRPSVIPSARYELSGMLAGSRNGSTATALTREPGWGPRAVRPATNHHAAAATSAPAPSAVIAPHFTRGPDRLRGRAGAAGGADVIPGDSSA